MTKVSGPECIGVKYSIHSVVIPLWRVGIMNPKQKVAAGFLVFRRLGKEIQYLLLQTSYGENHWSPPKG